MSLIRLGVLSVALVFGPLCSCQLSAEVSPAYNYDRVTLIGMFIGAVYPELNGQPAEIGFTAAFDGISRSDIHTLHVNPCVNGRPPAAPVSVPEPVSKEAKAFCATIRSSGNEDFLQASVEFGSRWERPILRFAASGSFIDSEVQEVRKEIEKNRFWTEEDAENALSAKKPRFGPNRKNEFSSGLPIKGIRKATGCLLRPGTAKFQIMVSNQLPPQLEWVVSGTTTLRSTAKSSDKCGATFEPFNGRLVTFWQ